MRYEADMMQQVNLCHLYATTMLLCVQDAVTHDVVKKMPYLDMCFSEVLRLHPPAGR